MLKYILGFSVIIPLLFACTETKEGKMGTVEVSSEVVETSTKAPSNQQIVVVQTSDWDAVEGSLRRYEWEADAWKQVGEDWPIVVGKKGMAWGKGIKSFGGAEGPIKKEGDKKSPAGVFVLGSAFGYALDPGGIQVPYIPVVSTTMCIEDGASTSYNQIIDEGSTEADWNSTDHMLRKDDLYEWGVFVAHNSPNAEAGKGSCIFLHVWRQNDSGTAGCTAMEKSNMKELIEWLKPEKAPLLIQMPKSAGELEQELKGFKIPNR